MAEAPAADRAIELRSALRGFVARRVSADAVDDVVQEIFLRLARSEAEPEDLRAWVHSVARSVVADYHRRRAARPPSGGPHHDREPAEEAGDDADELRARQILAAWLAVEVGRLPAPYAETLRLTELERLPHAEVAEHLGVAKGTIKARVSRGRALLRERLDACCHVEVDARNRVVDLEPRAGCC